MKLSEMKVKKGRGNIENLTPPRPVIKKIPQEETMDIDYEKIARSSEFKRLVYLIYTGKTHRGTREDLDVKLKSHQESISMVEVIKHDSVLLREIRSNPLYLKQKSKNNN